MNQVEINRRMLLNWEKAGKPMCIECHQPVYGLSNIAAWKKNGCRCFSCALVSVNIREHAYLSIPPHGIRD